jgi:hypothetical protein
MTISNHHFKTTIPLDELVAVVNYTCSKLSIFAEEVVTHVGDYVQPNWECTAIINCAACSFVINTWEYENETAVEFRRVSGSRYAYKEMLSKIHATLTGANVKETRVQETRVQESTHENVKMTADYIVELVGNEQLCLNGLLVLSNTMNEKLVWHLGTLYDTILEKAHLEDEEVAVAAIVCLNKYINYLVFTKELGCRMCSVVERCREWNPYHVKREALKFALTLSLKIPSIVRETGILGFAEPNKKDLITYQYVSRIQEVLSFLT